MLHSEPMNNSKYYIDRKERHMSIIKRRVAQLLMALLVLTGGTLITATPATAASSAALRMLRTGTEAGPFNVVPRNNLGKCLDVTNNSAANGTAMQIYDCLGSQQYNQIFYLFPVSGTPYYRIAPASTWKCLDIRGASMANYAVVQQYSCLGDFQRNQIWDVQYNHSVGGFTIAPTHTFKPMTIAGGWNHAAVYQHLNINYWHLIPV